MKRQCKLPLPANLPLPIAIPLPANSPLGFDIDYDGLVYGGGATLVGAIDRLFGSITTVYTETDLDVGDSAIDTIVIKPKGGIADRYTRR